MSRAGALLLLAALSGCMVGQRTSAPDADTDGLPDVIETEGWNITVVRTFLSCFGEASRAPEIVSSHVDSNELREDTDDDGVSDFDEYYNQGDPRNNDTDADGLSDGEEWEARKDDSLFAPSRLKLNASDSDADCLSDGEEVEGLSVPGFGLRQTDPTTDDTDHDGWTDAWEIRRSHTDPTDPDSDDDGAQDRQDVDPLRDVWLRLTFTSLLVRSSGTGGGARILLGWDVPVEDGSQPPSMPFEVTRGQTTSVPSTASPGWFDLDDRQGGPIARLNFRAYLVDEGGRITGILDVNPYHSRQPVIVALDVVALSWSFGRADGSQTEQGRVGVVDTAEAELRFEFEASGPRDER